MSPKAREVVQQDTGKIGRRLPAESFLKGQIKHPLGMARTAADHVPETLGAKVPLLHEVDGRSSIGQAIRLTRREKGLSQEGLARKAGIDRTTIARVECGIFKTLSVEKLEGIAWALGLEMKDLILKARSMVEGQTCRSHLNRIAFSLDYPEDGFRIVSILPKRREFFFGRIEVLPQKNVASAKLPHPEQIYLHVLEGKVHLTWEVKEYLLKPGDCFAFSGFRDYELYNPDLLKTAVSLFITYPSFVFL